MRSARPVTVLVAGLAGCTVAAPAGAQVQEEGGAVVVGRRESLNRFVLDRLDAAVNFFGQWRRDTLETADGQKRVDSEEVLRGDVELSGRGFVGHKDLLELNGFVRLGVEEIDIDSDTAGLSQDDTSTLYFYDVSGLLLGQGRVPTTLYSRRELVLLDREFAGSIESTNTEHGVMARIRSEAFPTFVHYFHRDIDQDDRLGISDFSVVQDTLTVRSETTPSERQRITLDYTFDSVEEARTSLFTNSFERHDLLLVHTLDFGARDEHHLRSSARYFDQSGEFPLRRLRLDELLRLEHGERLESRYDLTLENQDRQGASQDFVRGQASLRHRLFESLVTSASVSASRLETSDSFTSDEFAGDLALRYTKSVPYGRLDATGALGVARQDDSERGEPFDIVNRSAVVPDGVPLVISQSNVVGGSVVVKDASGVRVFTEGIDYTVRVFPDRVEIRRIVGGAIDAGEMVLVDFTVGPQPGSTIDTLSGAASLRYNFETGALAGLSPYVSYRESDRSVESPFEELVFAEDLRELTYGAEYRRGPWTFLAERQEREADFSPFDATRLEARYARRMGDAGALSLTLTHEDIEYPREDDRLRLNRATLRWDGRLSREVDVSARLLFRDEDSDRFGDTTGFEQAVELTWRRGATTISAAVRNSDLDSDREDRSTQTLSLGLRRSF